MMNNWDREFKLIRNTIDTDLAYQFIKKISSISGCREGYRLAGTKGEKETIEYITQTINKMGIYNLRRYRVPVNKWILHKGEVSDVNGRLKYNVTSYPGCKGGIQEGELIYAGKGFKDFYHKHDVKGKIILIDMDYNIFPSQIIPAKEAFIHGARAVLLTHLSEAGVSHYYKDTYFTCNGECDDSLGLIGYIPAYNAYKLIQRKGERFRIEIDIEEGRGYGYNLEAELKGEEDFQIILGAHHDAYFKGVIDNASGLALLVTLAKLLREGGYNNRYTIKFVFFTAEEYGVKNTIYDYLRGSYIYFSKMPEIQRNKVLLFINIDAIGYYKSPIGMIITPDYYELFKPLIENISPLIQNGINIIQKPGLWYDMWSAVSQGIGSINLCSIGGTDYYEKYYHTQKDDIYLFSQERFREYAALAFIFVKYIDGTDAPIPSFKALLNDYLRDLDLKKAIEADERTRITIDKVRVYSSRVDDAIHIINKGKYTSRKRILESIMTANRIRKILYSFIYSMGKDYPTEKIASYNYEYLQNMMYNISLILHDIKRKDYSKVLERIERLDMLKWAKHISKETYNWIYHRILEDDYWAKNKLPQYINLYSLIENLSRPDILEKELQEKAEDIEVKWRMLLLRILEMLYELSEYFQGLYTWMLDIDEEDIY